MPKLKLTVEQLLDRRGSFLDLRLLAGRGGLKREITEPRVQKQGLILVGVVSSVRAGRIQVLGQTELDYMAELDAEGLGLACRSLAQSAAAALLISSGLPCPETLALACEETSMPV
ncbi:MAG: hypothetical protein OSB21_02415, partial [Myxococcota bacterium]|nr:hypothetical protein [Myxococcota bacterium]